MDDSKPKVKIDGSGNLRITTDNSLPRWAAFANFLRETDRSISYPFSQSKHPKQGIDVRTTFIAARHPAFNAVYFSKSKTTPAHGRTTTIND